MEFTTKQLKDILNKVEIKEFLFAYDLLQKDKTIKKIEITEKNILIEREMDAKELFDNEEDEDEEDLGLKLDIED